MLLPVIVTKNGTAKQCLELSKALLNSGHQITIITCTYIPETADSEFRMLPVISVLPFPVFILKLFNLNIFVVEKYLLLTALLSTPLLRFIIRYHRPDVIHSHDWMTMWIQSGIRKNNIKKIATINDVPPRFDKSMINRLKLYLDRYASSRLDAITVLDKRNNSLVTSWLQVDSKKVFIIRSGVDKKKYLQFIPRSDIRKQLHISAKSKIVISANILSPHRRFEDIITAISIISKSYNVIFILLSTLNANVQYANKLKLLIKTLNIHDRVIIINKFLTDKERMEFLHASDMLVFPNYPQTWGLTVLESLALGVPVIVSRGSGVSDILHDKVDSLLYDPGNIKQLTNAIEYYIKFDSIRRMIATKGKDYVLSTFTWETYAQAMETLYS